MKRIHINCRIIKGRDDISFLEDSAEQMLNEFPDANITWLAAAGQSFAVITSIFEWEDGETPTKPG